VNYVPVTVRLIPFFRSTLPDSLAIHAIHAIHATEIVDPARLATPHRIRIIAHHEHLFDVAA
jgi:hypothetical protein